MRVLNLISSSGLFGAERVVVELSKGLIRIDQCQPIIGVIKNIQNPHIELAEEATGCGIESVIFPCCRQFDIKLVMLLRKYIRKNKIDIVHCHGYKSNFYGLLASVMNVPCITTNHNWLTSHWKLKIYCLLDSLWIRFFDRIVGVSDEIKQDMMKYKISENKIYVINNGIDLDRFTKDISALEIKKEINLNEKSKVIGIIGSLKIEKGHSILFKAAKEILKVVNDVTFLIVGDGPLRKQLEKEAHELGIDNNIVFLGYRRDVVELLSIMNIFVLSSVKEGLPMVLLEAMAAKRVVIATSVGAIPKVIDHNKSGVLVESNNAAELKKAILELLNNDVLGEKMRLAGYERIASCFSSEIMAGKYLGLYRDILR